MPVGSPKEGRPWGISATMSMAGLSTATIPTR